MSKSHKDLLVWQKAIDFVVEIYRITAELPKDELYGISQQMRRAAVSIPSNIAEGQHRKNIKEFLQFLRISYGSGAELETQLIITEKLYPKINFIKSKNMLDEIQKMLTGLIQKLETVN
ncbi:MAG: four helix bundle protein [Patescibacteria group bacterium]